jgi:ABC-type multidrug transport system permease subunit
MTRLETLIDPPIIDVEIVEPEVEDDAPEPGFADLFFPSMLFMTLFFMASGMSEDYWVERQHGTLRRALQTPHGAAAFLGGKVFAGALIIGVVTVFALVAARYAFDIDVRNFAFAGLWAVLSGALLLLLMIPVWLYASSQRGGNLISSLLVFPLLILGGSFFPFEFMPEGMAAVGRLTPNGWALTEFQSIIMGDVEPSSLGARALGVVLVGAVLFVIASRRLGGRFARG